MEFKKSAARYLTEFTVIFIAVFMGFLAENFRENMSERRKELTLINSLLNDLKADSISLLSLIEVNYEKKDALDSFIKIRQLDFSNKSNLVLFYDSWKPIKMWDAVIFQPSRAALNQLMNTGVLSSINPGIATVISDYDVKLNRNDFANNNYYKHVEETFRMIYDMIDYQSIWNDPPEFPPLETSESNLMKFFNLSADLMYTVDGYVVELELISAQISKLISSIETEYGRKLQ